MAKPKPIFKILLVYVGEARISRDFGEGDGFSLGQSDGNFLTKCAKEARFPASDYFVDASKSEVGSRDLVCYMLNSEQSSIV